MFLLVNYMPREIQVERFETEKEEVIEQIREPWMSDEDAVQAAKDVVRKKELQSELKSIDEDIAKLQAKRKEVATELSSY
jgi:phage terminase small subunit